MNKPFNEFEVKNKKVFIDEKEVKAVKDLDIKKVRETLLK